MADGIKISELTESQTIKDEQFFAVSDGIATTKVAYSTIKNDLIDYSEELAEVISPTVTPTPIDGGHMLTIVDINGTTTFDVMDGETGPRGPQGIPGPQGPTGTFEDLTTAQVQELASYVVDDACVRAFDTVADMQAAVGLKAGMICHTNGFNAAGDGGAAYYTIGTTGTANGMDVLTLQGGLFATLIVNGIVTPEMIGAPFFTYGQLDGTNDARYDCTDYIQHLATNYDTVGFRFDMGHGYYVTDTINLTMAHQLFTGGDFYKSGFSDGAGSIVFVSDSTTTAGKFLFNVTRQQTTFYGMSIDTTQNNGVFYAKTGVADVDIMVVNSHVSQAGLVFDIWGRGVEVVNCLFGSCYDVARFNWDDSEDTTGHPAGTGQRRIYFKDCVFHSTRHIVITFQTGKAWGFQFLNNTMDDGRAVVIYAYDGADGWVVSGNVLQALAGNYAIYIEGVAKDCVFSDNRFQAQADYWTSVPNNFIRFFTAGATNIVIAKNTFDGCSGAPIRALNFIGAAIMGNVALNCGNESGTAFLYLVGASDKGTSGLTLIGNVMLNGLITHTLYMRGVSATNPTPVANSVITGNIVNLATDNVPGSLSLDTTVRKDF